MIEIFSIKSMPLFCEFENILFKKIHIFFAFCTTLIFHLLHIHLVPSDDVYTSKLVVVVVLMLNHYLNSNVRFFRLNNFQTFAIHERPYPCPIFA